MGASGHETELKKDAICTEILSVNDARGALSYPHISFPKVLNRFHLNFVFDVYTILRELNFCYVGSLWPLPYMKFKLNFSQI